MAISFGERQSDAAILVPFVRAVQPGLLKSGRRLSPQFTTTEGQNSHPPLQTLDQIMTSSEVSQSDAREGGNKVWDQTANALESRIRGHAKVMKCRSSPHLRVRQDRLPPGHR